MALRLVSDETAFCNAITLSFRHPFSIMAKLVLSGRVIWPNCTSLIVIILLSKGKSGEHPIFHWMELEHAPLFG